MSLRLACLALAAASLAWTTPAHAQTSDGLAVRILGELDAAGQSRNWTAGEALRLRAAAAQYAGRADLVIASITPAAEILSERLGPNHPRTLLARVGIESPGERRRRALIGVPAPGYLHAEAAFAVGQGG
jgi:hypothetical protein